MMQRIEDSNARSSRGIEDVVWDAFVGLGNTLQAIPYFSALGNEVVVRVDHDEACDVLLVSHIGHVLARHFSGEWFSGAEASCSSYVSTGIAASNREAA
jgi:hypothetical protein